MEYELGNSEDGITYPETSPFVRLLGTPGRVQILDVFLRKHYAEFTANEVAEMADIARTTVDRNIEPLKEFDVIIERASSSGARYRLNDDSPIAKILREAQIELLEYSEQITSAEGTLETNPWDLTNVFKFESEVQSKEESDEKFGKSLAQSR